MTFAGTETLCRWALKRPLFPSSALPLTSSGGKVILPDVGKQIFFFFLIKHPDSPIKNQKAPTGTVVTTVSLWYD